MSLKPGKKGREAEAPLIDMAPRFIFLVGAPLPSNLDWDNDELFDAPVPPFHDTDTPSTEHQPYLGQDSIKWRVLRPLSPDIVEDHQSFYWGPKDPSFLKSHQLINTDSTSNDDEDDTGLSQFYDHSFAIHETSEISASELQEDLTQELDSIAADPPNEELCQLPPFRFNGPVRDLKDIPTARHLQSIVPQTMSVNLVVGVIAVHPPHRVVTRQWKKELDIIELVVGDETRAGFGVNFWLPASAPDQMIARAEGTGLGRVLRTLRPQDIVLLRTVGLGSFRDQVYGQSLRGGMTQVNLLHRPSTNAGELDKVLPASVEGDLPQKVRRVREWILRFVGTDGVGGISPGMPETKTERGNRLPPDTQ